MFVCFWNFAYAFSCSLRHEYIFGSPIHDFCLFFRLELFRQKTRTNLIFRKMSRNVDRHWKVKNDNNISGQSKFKSSTPIQKFKSKKWKRLFDLKSLSCTPIKSPLRKKFKFPSSKPRRKPVTPKKQDTNDDTNLDGTWIYPLTEYSSNQKNYPVNGPPMIRSSQKKMIKRTLLYNSDEIDQNKDSVSALFTQGLKICHILCIS